MQAAAKISANEPAGLPIFNIGNMFYNKNHREWNHGPI
jgi:hypothetical protein